LSTYVIPRTSGGEAAALAAFSTISSKYRFAQNDQSSIINIVANRGSQGNSNNLPTSTDTHQTPQKHLPAEEDLDETEWVEMTAKDADAASIASQEIPKR
jgi:hypothetical protein